ncbi:F0F1 ATP synthase subunit A [Agilicoccus flavus]|uniref:F0F1 ATP synthase subunit A n=1 Tax=Agilicoccus flavus TaxID=2775968 RepID=UPI001CF66DEF|nr:F0F1 ATP synthase subunit A [Agilicoccus flavus]
MSLNAWGASLGAVVAAEGDSHFPPKVADFWQPLVTFGHVGNTTIALTRPMVVLTLVALVLSVWLVTTTRRAAAVPSKGQWFTEQVYDFVRNNVARDMIGTKDFMRFVPLLFALFTFILLSNLSGVIPGIQMPPMARIGFPIALTLIVYVVYHWIGIKKHGGFGRYLKWMIPPGIPGWLMPLIVPLELLTYFITRPLTLALRLFGNMFAGHMLLVVFIMGGWLLLTSGSIGLALVTIPAWILGFVMTAFEILVQVLQAFVFTLLAASYFGGALADEH